MILFIHIIYILFDFLLGSQLQPNNDVMLNRFIGERLYYKMEYLNLSVATLNFYVTDTIPMNHQQAYHLKVHARSIRSAGLLFSLDNIYETYFDIHTYLPIKSIKNIHQKNIRHDLIINFHHEQNKATIGDSIIWSIPGDCYDYFSMLYFLRIKKLATGDTIHFHLDSEYLVLKVEAVVLPDQEFIQVPAGKFNSRKMKVKFSMLTQESRPWKTDLLTNRLAAPGLELMIWFSDDEIQLPLKISYQQSVFNTCILLEHYDRGKQD